VTTPANFTDVSLPAVLDIKEAAPLAAKLRALRGQPLSLDASRVEHLGALCLQILLAARNTWASDNVPIAVRSASSRFSECLTLFGAALSTT
jgi:chemotaxis protein CheX